MSTTTRQRKSPQRTRSQERSLHRVRQHATKRRNNNNPHQSYDLTEDSAFLSGASSFTQERNDDDDDDERKSSTRTKRRGVKPHQSTTSGMTFALISSNDEASSSSASTYSDEEAEEPFHETLTSLALSQVFPPDSVFGTSTTFEVDPPRPIVVAAKQHHDQTSVDSHPHHNNQMTLEQKAWAGIEDVLKQSTNSVHREDVLSADVLRALSDSYSTFHSRSVVVADDPRLAPHTAQPNTASRKISAADHEDHEDSFTVSPSRELTGYLGRLTTRTDGMPALMNSSFSSIQTDLQSVASATVTNHDVAAAQPNNTAVVIQPKDDYQEHIMQEFMNVMVALSEQQEDRNAEEAETEKAKDPPGEKVGKIQWNRNNNSSSKVGFENNPMSKVLREDEPANEHHHHHPNKSASKAIRDKAQQMISPRQHRKLKKPLSSSLTQSKPNDDPPISPRRTRSSSPAKIRSLSPANDKNVNITRSASRNGGESPHRRRVRRQHSHDRQNASKSCGEFSQETLPIDFDASLPSHDPQNLVTRRSFLKVPMKNARESHPMQSDDDGNPFFSPAAFTNASAIPTPKNRNHWPTLLVVSSPKEDKLNNSMPSLVTLNETELSQVEAAQGRKWASFGDLGLDEGFRDEEDGLERVKVPKSPASPRRRAGRRHTRYHYTPQRKSIPRKKLAVHASVEKTLAEEENNGVEAFINYFRPEEQVSSSPTVRPVQQSSGLLPSLQRFLRSPRRDRKKVIESNEKGGPLAKLKKGMGSLLWRNKRSASTPNAARIDTGLRDAQFYPDMEDDQDESGYGNLLD